MGAAGTIALGQLLALSVTASGYINELLARSYNCSLPTVQAALLYGTLAVVYLGRWLCCGGRRVNLRAVCAERGGAYLLYSLLDFVSTVLVIQAYAYTSISVIALLQTVSTPAVIVLSRLCLGTRFRALQYAGAGLCVAGVVFLSVSLGLQSSQNTLYGCLLSVGSALVYAVSNVLAEWQLDNPEASPAEFLALLGTGGTVWSLACLGLLRRAEALDYVAQPLPVHALVALYLVAIFGFYSLLPVFLRRASATLFNLSLFTISIYSALVNHFVFADAMVWSFPAAFLVITAGILLYSYDPAGPGDKPPAAAA